MKFRTYLNSANKFACSCEQRVLHGRVITTRTATRQWSGGDATLPGATGQRTAGKEGGEDVGRHHGHVHRLLASVLHRRHRPTVLWRSVPSSHTAGRREPHRRPHPAISRAVIKLSHRPFLAIPPASSNHCTGRHLAISLAAIEPSRRPSSASSRGSATSTVSSIRSSTPSSTRTSAEPSDASSVSTPAPTLLLRPATERAAAAAGVPASAAARRQLAAEGSNEATARVDRRSVRSDHPHSISPLDPSHRLKIQDLENDGRDPRRAGKQIFCKSFLLPPPKEVMFSLRSVCLSVCLSVCPSNNWKIVNGFWRNFLEG